MSKPKILVEIIHKNNQITRKKCPIDEDRVIIEPPKRGRGGAGWQPKFYHDSILKEVKGWWKFKKIIEKVQVIEGSNECIRFSINDDYAEVNLGRRDLKRFAQAEILHLLRYIKAKIELPLAFWLVVGLVFVNLFLTFLIANRFGVI